MTFVRLSNEELETKRMSEATNQLNALQADRYIVILTPSKALKAKGRSAYTFGIPGNLGNRAKGYTAAELLEDGVLAMLAAKNASGYSIGIKCKSQRYHYASLYDVSHDELLRLKANDVQACLVSVVRKNVHCERFFAVVMRFEKTDAAGDVLYAAKVSGSYQLAYGEKTQKDLECCIPLCGFKDLKSGMFVNANCFKDRNCPTSKERYQTFARIGYASQLQGDAPALVRDCGNDLYFESCRELIIFKASKAGDRIYPAEIDNRLVNQLVKEKYDNAEIQNFMANRLKPKVLESIDF